MEDFTRELTPGNTKAAMKAVKKQAEPMYTALTKVQADPGFAKLSKEVRELLAELLQGLKKPVDTDK